MDAPPPPPPPLSVIAGAIQHSTGTKYYNLATFIIVLYDHMLTFDVEVEKVWKQRWSIPKALWFVFRYLTPLIQLGSILSDHLTTWTPESCLQWLWWRVVADEIITAATTAVLVLRIWVLFDRAHWPLAVMLAAILAQTATTIWSWFAFTVAVLPPGFNGCYPVPKTPGQVGQVASLFISLLVLDCVIFLLTVARIVKQLSNRSPTALPLLTMMLRDGVVYFMIICVVNLVNVLLIELPQVPTDLKPLNTEFTPNITVIMVSRLFLNLRTKSRPSHALIAPSRQQSTSGITTGTSSMFDSTSHATLIGNLDEPVQYASDRKIDVSVDVRRDQKRERDYVVDVRRGEEMEMEMEIGVQRRKGL